MLNVSVTLRLRRPLVRPRMRRLLALLSGSDKSLGCLPGLRRRQRITCWTFAEINESLELIERLREPDGLTLNAAAGLLVETKIPIYDAHDVFDEPFSIVRQALEISEDADVADGDE